MSHFIGIYYDSSQMGQELRYGALAATSAAGQTNDFHYITAYFEFRLVYCPLVY
ncbi:hypothetical protein ES707_17263 [subsurface metagenome]